MNGLTGVSSSYCTIGAVGENVALAGVTSLLVDFFAVPYLEGEDWRFLPEVPLARYGVTSSPYLSASMIEAHFDATSSTFGQ